MRKAKHSPAVRIEPTKLAFDYENHEIADKREELERCAGEIETRKTRVLEDMLAIGEMLKGAQELLAHKGNGTFCAWVDQRIGLSPQQARNYIRATRASKVCKTRFANFSMRALTALGSKLDDEKTKPHVKTAIQACNDAALEGLTVTEKVAKATLAIAEVAHLEGEDPAEKFSHYFELLDSGAKVEADDFAQSQRRFIASKRPRKERPVSLVIDDPHKEATRIYEELSDRIKVWPERNLVMLRATLTDALQAVNKKMGVTS